MTGLLQQRTAERDEARAEVERLRDASTILSDLLDRYDPEYPGAAFAPDPGCQHCTEGQTPKKWETETCPYHRALTLLGRGA